MPMIIRNISRNTVIAGRARPAETIWSRTRGLMFQRFEGFDGMILRPGNAIHMCFMRMPIDVIFFDKRLMIVKMVPQLAPWSLFCGALGAAGVLELPVGAIARSQSQPGDQLEFVVA
jgi:uncharacterized membrane protein (UPF0127 family)